MVSKLAIILIAAGAAAAGLIIGGLIGHFATKSPTSQIPSTSPLPVTSSPLVDNVNNPNPVKDANNRKILFDTVSAEEIRKISKEYSRTPHLAGSPRNNELGDMIEQTWKSYNFETKKDVFNVLLSYPGGNTSRNQAFIYNSADDMEFESQKVEKELVKNADADEIVPPFNGYAKSGDVKVTKFHYVNYCRVEDFDYITINKSIDVTGAIVICRYGKIFRGNKVIQAEENGAVGVILFNDPQENVDLSTHNATFEDTFPNSWFLPPSGVERGSVMAFSGDPLTAGFPAKDYAIRKSVEQIRREKVIPNIPTQPIGYDDARKFLEILGGPEVDLDTWKGKLDGITYRYGNTGPLPNGKKVRIANYNTDERKDITNVFGIIKGAVEPDRYVLVGNHRDAWMNGATDATSGTSVMMETSRVFSELMKTGWRPRRTIIFCSWDGEEYGIIGSIEWLDEVKVLVGARAVAYLNCDSGVVYRQVLKAAASPLIWDLMYKTAKMVPHPDIEGESIYDEWQRVTGKEDDANSKPKIGDLGSGSDHTGFYHRHGITSMDVVYHYDKKKMNISAYYPLYHTSYDTYENVANFTDPTFNFHKALTQFFLEMTRSVSDSVMVPFIVEDYAKRLEEVYPILVANVQGVLRAKNVSLLESLEHLKTAIDGFKREARIFDQRVKDTPGTSASWNEVRRINDQLFLLERSFLYPLGILDRKYIKHVVFAPSATNSYASAAFPGISDALYKINMTSEEAWDKVKVELTKAVYTIQSATKAITTDLII